MKRTDAALTRGAVPARERTGPKLRVLIAEKEALAAVPLKVLLEGLGHEVVKVAHGAQEAVGSAWELGPDLIIMDIRLPVTAYLIDGIEAARMILRQGAVPIILLTPYFSADLAQRARRSGFMAHLLEPVDGEQLRSSIALALARFGELQALREEATDLVEAFRRLEHHRQSTNKIFQAIASAIVKADELLVRRLDFAQCLLGIHRAMQGGLR